MRGRGFVEVQLRDERIIECRAVGAITVAAVADGQRAMDEILARDPGRFRILRDGLDVECVDGGATIQSIRWFQARAERFDRSAIVARMSTIVALARAYRYFLPNTPHGVFATRADALEFLGRSRQRRTSGIAGPRAVEVVKKLA